MIKSRRNLLLAPALLLALVAPTLLALPLASGLTDGPQNIGRQTFFIPASLFDDYARQWVDPHSCAQSRGLFIRMDPVVYRKSQFGGGSCMFEPFNPRVRDVHDQRNYGRSERYQVMGEWQPSDTPYVSTTRSPEYFSGNKAFKPGEYLDVFERPVGYDQHFPLHGGEMETTLLKPIGGEPPAYDRSFTSKGGAIENLEESFRNPFNSREAADATARLREIAGCKKQDCAPGVTSNTQSKYVQSVRSRIGRPTLNGAKNVFKSIGPGIGASGLNTGSSLMIQNWVDNNPENPAAVRFNDAAEYSQTQRQRLLTGKDSDGRELSKWEMFMTGFAAYGDSGGLGSW